MDRQTLENLGREELVAEARRIGVQRPEVMTRVELVDEVLRLGTPNPVERKQVRGWLGVARDLLASAIELGLNLPDAAALIRGDVRFEPLRPEQRPVATVTLAEIYGAQGHFERALGMLDEVLAGEPDHEAAQRLRTRLSTEREARSARQRADAPDSAPEAPAAASEAPSAQDEHRFDDYEPDHATLVPNRPLPDVLEDEDGERMTLSPARPEPHSLEDEEPDHVTLVPPRPEVRVYADEDPDGVTLVPARPGVDGFDDDGDDGATLVPEMPRDGLPPSSDLEPDAPTLPPSLPAVIRDTDPGDANPSLPSPSEEPSASWAPDESGIVLSPSEAAAALPQSAPPGEPGIVLSRLAAGSAAVYYELGNLRLEGGHVAVVRVVEHRPRPGGVERIERDVPATDPSGILTVFDLEYGSFVRAALGKKYDGRFVPAAVAAEVSLAADGIAIGWAPRAGVDYAALADRSQMAKRVAAS